MNITDSIPPSIYCPNDVEILVNNQCRGYFNSSEITYEDNCGILNITNNEIEFTIGNFTEIYTVTDVSFQKVLFFLTAYFVICKDFL